MKEEGGRRLTATWTLNQGPLSPSPGSVRGLGKQSEELGHSLWTASANSSSPGCACAALGNKLMGLGNDHQWLLTSQKDNRTVETS